jgi:hypothetical protein
MDNPEPKDAELEGPVQEGAPYEDAHLTLYLAPATSEEEASGKSGSQSSAPHSSDGKDMYTLAWDPPGVDNEDSGRILSHPSESILRDLKVAAEKVMLAWNECFLACGRFVEEITPLSEQAAATKKDATVAHKRAEKAERLLEVKQTEAEAARSAVTQQLTVDRETLRSRVTHAISSAQSRALYGARKELTALERQCEALQQSLSYTNTLATATEQDLADMLSDSHNSKCSFGVLCHQVQECVVQRSGEFCERPTSPLKPRWCGVG